VVNEGHGGGASAYLGPSLRTGMFGLISTGGGIQKRRKPTYEYRNSTPQTSSY